MTTDELTLELRGGGGVKHLEGTQPRLNRRKKSF